MSEISSATVRALINFLCADKENSLNKEGLLAHIDVSEELIYKGQGLLESTIYDEVFSFAVQKLNRNNIGFEFGQTISPDRWGILGYIAFTSPTLHQALTKQRKYQSLAGTIGTPLTESLDNLYILKWIPSYQCNYHVVEEIITGWAALAKKLSLNKIHPKAIYFCHSFIGNELYKSEYEKFFGCPVHFNHEFNGIEIEKHLLDLPLNTYDREINEALCLQASTMLSQLIETSPVNSVRQFIINQLPIGVPDIDEVASQLGLSVRTLQRKLSENEQTFSSMVDEIRHELALSYLKNTKTKVIYIAQMLGFSEQSAFQRAFKRWTNMTPKHYRECA